MGVVAEIAYFTVGAIDPQNIGQMFRPGDRNQCAILLCWLALGSIGVIVQHKYAPAKKETTARKLTKHIH